jgi:acyl carrier protein
MDLLKAVIELEIRLGFEVSDGELDLVTTMGELVDLARAKQASAARH